MLWLSNNSSPGLAPAMARANNITACSLIIITFSGSIVQAVCCLCPMLAFVEGLSLDAGPWPGQLCQQ